MQIMEGLLHYINPAHAISLLSALNEERLKGHLCDVHLIVGDQKFRAHKNVLAASSEYFHTLFTNKDNDSQTVFQLDFCEPDAFDNVLNYIYSSSLFVEKGSLAAVQELGYSLGISFLTNILSKTPQGPFSTCSNKSSFFQDDDDESNSKQRSVIVRQSRNEMQENVVGNADYDFSQSSKSSSFTLKTSTNGQHGIRSVDPLYSSSSSENRDIKESSASYTKLLDPPRSVDEENRSGWMRRGDTLLPKSQKDKELADGVGSQHLHSKTMEVPLKRPDLASGASVCGSIDTSFIFGHSGKEMSVDRKEDRNMLYFPKLGLVVPSDESVSENQSIDRSGPLVKSLLRRSLSMDSQVPAYLSSIESHPLCDSFTNSSSGETPSDANRKQPPNDSVEKSSTTDKTQGIHPHRLRSFSASQSTNQEVASPVTEVQIKTEPSSPISEPSDPAEILRVTVGDSSTSNSKDLYLKTEEIHTHMSKIPVKRRFQADVRRQPSKRLKMKGNSLPKPQEHFMESSSPSHADDFPDSEDDKEEYSELEEIRPNKKFKCKHCLKIFRSTAGLHRHVNMYHNPEKPYACDICHKRFHTNFKVWTHCQTQHGIVKNPSPASSSHAVLDEKFQRKLIDIVREREIKKARDREIKKALIGKLRRGKQGFQGQSSCQAQLMKRNLRSRGKGAYICSYCGKVYRFLSQFKQHIKMHPGEKPSGNKHIKPKERMHIESPVENKEAYHCRHCNAKLYSLIELGNHERLCRNITVCPYCSLRFSSSAMKHDHENRCEYKKLTCLECMRTFKSSFSIWRHQVEVHNQNTMAPTENFSLPLLDHNGEIGCAMPSNVPRIQSVSDPNKTNNFVSTKDDSTFSDSSEQSNFDSEDSSYVPEDLTVSTHFNIKIKEEPPDDLEDEICEVNLEPKEEISDKQSGIWSCEKCGKMFTVHKQLERHQELLCSVKPFICHVCNKAFRTNFRLWSHFQSHMPHAGEEPPCKDPEPCQPAKSPSPSPPPPPPPPPPLPPPPQTLLQKIQSIKPDSPTDFTDHPNTSEKLFAPQESDTLFYHAPPLSAITFKRQYMCKLCHRTFKTAFSLWSHEQTHN
ncbi:zinc finger and BTB domain-containing protein 21 isoform X2 [Ambystoma mexicanum]